MTDINYKGISCSYDEKDDAWRAYPESDLQWHDQSLPKLKSRIDKYLKSKSEYKDARDTQRGLGQAPVYFCGYNFCF